jgi:SPP1 gp7 family putative phage head morphogenesis protein
VQTQTVDVSATRQEKQAYQNVRRAELQYGIRLRKLARNVGEIVNVFPPGDPQAMPKLTELLRKYAEMIRPWAQTVAASMLADVSYRDEKNWNELAKTMGVALRQEMLKAPTGETLKLLQAEQVRLIQSIPLEAAERVHKLTMEGLISSARFDEIKRDIQRTTHVTESRATLIARTEVGRASTNLTQARATYIGSDGYVWRTSRDADVRPSHRKMEGKLVKWDKPPTLDNLTGHAGCLPNCRCYPEVIVPDIFKN